MKKRTLFGICATAVAMIYLPSCDSGENTEDEDRLTALNIGRGLNLANITANPNETAQLPISLNPGDQFIFTDNGVGVGANSFEDDLPLGVFTADSSGLVREADLGNRPLEAIKANDYRWLWETTGNQSRGNLTVSPLFNGDIIFSPTSFEDRMQKAVDTGAGVGSLFAAIARGQLNQTVINAVNQVGVLCLRSKLVNEELNFGEFEIEFAALDSSEMQIDLLVTSNNDTFLNADPNFYIIRGEYAESNVWRPLQIEGGSTGGDGNTDDDGQHGGHTGAVAEKGLLSWRHTHPPGAIAYERVLELRTGTFEIRLAKGSDEVGTGSTR